MGSRFSAFQGKGAIAAQPVEAPADIAKAVQIPRSNRAAPAKQDALSAQDVRMNDRTLDARVRLHRKLIEEINLVALERLPQDEMRKEIKGFVVEVAQRERLALNVSELESLVDDLVDEMVGLGPLEPLLKDPSISDILINGHENCFVERGGKLVPVAIPFKDEAHLLRIVNKIVAGVGRRGRCDRAGGGAPDPAPGRVLARQHHPLRARRRRDRTQLLRPQQPRRGARRRRTAR